jgi:hypothetical protein
MKRTCVLGSTAANARLVWVDAIIPPANTATTAPTSVSRRDIVGKWFGSFGCLSIAFMTLRKGGGSLARFGGPIRNLA